MGVPQSHLSATYGELAEWVAAICSEGDLVLDRQQGAIHRLNQSLALGPEKATDFLIKVISEPALRDSDGGNLFFRRLYGLWRAFETVDIPFLASYIDLLQALATDIGDIREVQLIAGLGTALAKVLETTQWLQPSLPQLYTEKADGNVDFVRLVELIHSHTHYGRFAADFVEAGGALLLNALCSRPDASAELRLRCVAAAARLSNWIEFPWTMDTINVALCAELLMSPVLADKDIATALVAHSLRFAPTQLAWQQASDQLRGIQISGLLLTNLHLAAHPDRPSAIAPLADGRRAYAVMTGTSALRRIEPPRVPEQPERLLLNTLWALGELSKEVDNARATLERGMPVVQLLFHGVAESYEEIQAALSLVSRCAATVHSQRAVVPLPAIQTALLSLGKVVLEPVELRTALGILGAATSHDGARPNRLSVLGSEYFLTVLSFLRHPDVSVAAETLTLLEHLIVDQELLPRGPREVVIQAVVGRINETTTGNRMWNVDEPVYFVGLWSVLYSLMFEARDAKVAAAHLNLEKLDAFLAQRRFQLRRALRNYINPILRAGRRNDLNFRNDKARLIQHWFLFYLDRGPAGMHRKRLNILTAYLYGMTALEEEWYQGVKIMRRIYLMKFI